MNSGPGAGFELRTGRVADLRGYASIGNVAACNLYQRQGCTLAEAQPGAYARLPEETRLIWRKQLMV